MGNLLAPIQGVFEGQIDFHGQQIIEILYTVLLISSGMVASLVGYIYQDIHLTVWIGLAGTIVTALAVVPPWPMYNKNPEKWLVPRTGKAAGAGGVVVDGIKVS